jgi:hypothetical protein
MAESQTDEVEDARTQLRDFFKSSSHLQSELYAIFGSKEETGSLSNLLDVEVGGLMKLFEKLKWVKPRKGSWTVKINNLEKDLLTMNAKYNDYNKVKYIELGSLGGYGSRDDATIELARTAIKQTIETMFPVSAADRVSNDTSTADVNLDRTQTPLTTPSTGQPPSTELLPSTPPRKEKDVDPEATLPVHESPIRRIVSNVGNALRRAQRSVTGRTKLSVTGLNSPASSPSGPICRLQRATDYRF